MRNFFENLWVNMNGKKAVIIACMLIAVGMIVYSATSKSDGSDTSSAGSETKEEEEGTSAEANELVAKANKNKEKYRNKEEKLGKDQSWSKLTHMKINSELSKKRIFSVMYDNSNDSDGGVNYDGLSHAAITYEALVDGKAKVMALFERSTEIQKEKIAPIGAVEPLFTNLVVKYHASWASNNTSQEINDKIKEKDDLPNLNVGKSEATLEDFEKIFAGRGLQNRYVDKDFFTFRPHKVESDVKAIPCVTVNIKYDKKGKGKDNVVDLNYDPSETKYQIHYENDLRKDNSETNNNPQKSIFYDNIIIIKANKTGSGVNETFDMLNKEGEGYYITYGTQVSIKWKGGKSYEDKTKFYIDNNGKEEELKINPGNMYISIIDEKESTCKTIDSRQGHT